MKYETPQMTTLTPAIKAIQFSGELPKDTRGPADSITPYESVSAYTDWE
jgi:hypothetical protein